MSRHAVGTLTTVPGLAVQAASTLTAARTGLWVLLAAHVVTMWGTQWDVRWHLQIGRDSFWIPPHVMTYSGVAVLTLVSFGILVWMTLADAGRGTLRILGLAGTRGYHLAAWGIALTVLAAPIDDLWHRLFGIDVTLWSPPHLLGLLGGVVNAGAGWLIAREVYPEGRRARRAALLMAGALVYGAVAFGLGPGIRTAYTHGGVRFFTYPMLAALLVPPVLIVTARLTRRRTAPVLALLVMVLLGLAGSQVARAGFAWIQPVSFIADEVAKDPTSPIAVTREIARKNGTAPGAINPTLLAPALLAALVMVAVDARRRPVLASLAYGLTLFVVLGLALARQPAFAQSLPSVGQVVMAGVVTGLAALAGGVVARGVTDGV
jgi:hypothetical protein